MSCICAKATDQWHGWECSITGGACMYLSPNQDQCADDYGEVRHTSEWKQEPKKKEQTVTSYIDDYKELRTLTIENPSLPLIFMAGDGCTNPDYAWTVASARAKKGIYLTSIGPNEEKMYSSEDDLREDIDDRISEQHGDWTDEEILEATVEELKKYEDKWIDVIYVYIEAY
ncbi:MAG: hypothetical protein AB9836_07665 [Aminipila sp.]